MGEPKGRYDGDLEARPCPRFILLWRWVKVKEIPLRIIQRAVDKGIAQQPEGRRTKSKGAWKARRAPCKAGRESTSH